MKEHHFFPIDPRYDYNSHLRQMDERQVFRGNEMQIDCKSTVQYLDGMRAPVEELRKLRNELEGGQALGRKSADIIQKIQISDRGNVVDPEAEASDLKGAKAKMVVFRDGLDSREVLAQVYFFAIGYGGRTTVRFAGSVDTFKIGRGGRTTVSPTNLNEEDRMVLMHCPGQELMHSCIEYNAFVSGGKCLCLERSLS